MQGTHQGPPRHQQPPPLPQQPQPQPQPQGNDPTPRNRRALFAARTRPAKAGPPSSSPPLGSGSASSVAPDVALICKVRKVTAEVAAEMLCSHGGNVRAALRQSRSPSRASPTLEPEDVRWRPHMHTIGSQWVQSPRHGDPIRQRPFVILGLGWLVLMWLASTSARYTPFTALHWPGVWQQVVLEPSPARAKIDYHAPPSEAGATPAEGLRAHAQPPWSRATVTAVSRSKCGCASLRQQTMMVGSCHSSGRVAGLGSVWPLALPEQGWAGVWMAGAASCGGGVDPSARHAGLREGARPAGASSVRERARGARSTLRRLAMTAPWRRCRV
jgi:hypothetical protein